MMAGEMQGEVFAGSHHLPPGEFSPLMNEIVIGANGTLELFHGSSYMCLYIRDMFRATQSVGDRSSKALARIRLF